MMKVSSNIEMLLAVGCTLFVVSFAQPNVDLCANCTIVNGAGYTKHPYDCDKFVQCHQGKDGVVIGEIQQCSFSTYWDDNLITCTDANITYCDNDMCTGQPNGKVFGSMANCRGYWKCSNGKAEAMCCPYGQKYTEIGCVDNEDDECKDRCFNEAQKVEVCDKRVAIDKPEMFEQKVTEDFWVPMPCAPGTAFIGDLCRCIALVDTDTEKRKCKPEVYLPFTRSHHDESGNGYFVHNQNVRVTNGVAKFNGANSRLIIPRFTNLEHRSTVVIEVKYTSKHTDLAIAQAIVSNRDCKNTPSIMISEDYANIYYGVGTSDVKFAVAHVHQEDVDPTMPAAEKEVIYKFDDGTLTGFIGNSTDVVYAPGFLRNVHCALHIGYAEDLRPFEGEIDELTVYLCNPYTE